jgi:hypothetical protein
MYTINIDMIILQGPVVNTCGLGESASVHEMWNFSGVGA